MKFHPFVLRAVTVATLVLGAKSLLAQSLARPLFFDAVAPTDFTVSPTECTVTAPPAITGAAVVANDSSAGAGCPQCESWGCGLGGCDDCCPYQICFSSGFDSFNGVPNLGEEISNFGFTSGVNAGFALPWLSEYGIGGQLGANYVISNLSGSYDPQGNKDTQQTFVTAGVFRHAQQGNPFRFGIAYDFIFTDNLGLFGQDPTLGQWRGQVGYAVSDCNEIGVWGTAHNSDTIRQFNLGPVSFPVRYRAIDQIDMYWRHKFCESGADSTLYIGVPTEDSLTFTGTKPGAVILGLDFTVPLSDRLSLFANGMYMPPTQAAGTFPALASQTWNVSFGLNFYFGCGSSRSSTVSGNCFAPLLPVANNGTFLVDSDGARPI